METQTPTNWVEHGGLYDNFKGVDYADDHISGRWTRDIHQAQMIYDKFKQFMTILYL